MTTLDPNIGKRRFAGGSTRDVFTDDEGQYVIDDDGVKIRGVWLLDAEADVPVIATAERCP